jgi:hypothetical protein
MEAGEVRRGSISRRLPGLGLDVVSGHRRADATMALDDFTAFLDKHRRCEDLNAGVEEPQFGYQGWWASCSCGVSLSRNLRTDEDAGH